MNTMNENAQAMTQVQATTSLTEAVVELTQLLKEAISLAKEEEAVSTTKATTAVTTTPETTTATTEATTTTATTTTDAEATTAETTTATTAPIIVIDDDDNVIATTGDLPCPPEVTEFKGSMIEEKPMDPIPTYEENAAEAKADDTAEAEETVPADEDADKYLDNISCDISTLYDISTYTLENEGYNIGTDHSPYAPMDNRSASFDNYKVYISKEIIKAETITGEFRMIVSEKNSGVKILDHSLKIINDTIKVFSSENTVRMDKIKDSKKLFRLLEIVEEVSALVMSKYIDK